MGTWIPVVFSKLRPHALFRLRRRLDHYTHGREVVAKTCLLWLGCRDRLWFQENFLLTGAPPPKWIYIYIHILFIYINIHIISILQIISCYSYQPKQLLKGNISNLPLYRLFIKFHFPKMVSLMIPCKGLLFNLSEILELFLCLAWPGG